LQELLDFVHEVVATLGRGPVGRLLLDHLLLLGVLPALLVVLLAALPLLVLLGLTFLL
jgi:hypothetical protein